MNHKQRDILVHVLVYHQRRADSGCHCGWNELGASWAEHVADKYQKALEEAGQ